MEELKIKTILPEVVSVLELTITEFPVISLKGLEERRRYEELHGHDYPIESGELVRKKRFLPTYGYPTLP